MISDGNRGFEWDPVKAASNERKHGVTFVEASTVFGDPNARVIDDPEHSDDEERFVILGVSMRANVLVVCHCCRSGGNSIRIISARKATKTESKAYWRCCHEG